MRKLILVPLLAFILGACGGAPAASPSSNQNAPAGSAPTTVPVASAAPAGQPTVTPVPLPTLVPATAAPPPSPTALQLATPLPATNGPISQQPAVVPPANAPVTAARQALALYLNISEARLTLQGSEATQWPDTSLGCPAPDALYPQVITPGFRLSFAANGQTYAVHTAESEAQMILCENKLPVQLAAAAPGDTGQGGGPPQVQPGAIGGGSPEGAALDSVSQPLVDRAKTLLAQDLGIKPDDITLASLEAVEWPDGALGCPQPGVMYLQVITAGYRVVLEAQGKQYNYHTDTRRQVVRCNQP